MRLSIGNGFADMPLIEVAVAQYARSRGATPDQCKLLASSVRHMANWINQHAHSKSVPGKIVVELEAIAGGACCTIEDWGAPINPFDSALKNVPSGLAEVDRASKGLRLLNLGHKGKRLCAVFPMDGVLFSPTPPEAEDLDTHAESQGIGHHIEIRAAQLDDAEGISSLIYSQSVVSQRFSEENELLRPGIRI